MAIKLLSVDQLMIGMYIVGLDSPGQQQASLKYKQRVESQADIARGRLLSTPYLRYAVLRQREPIPSSHGEPCLTNNVKPVGKRTVHAGSSSVL